MNRRHFVKALLILMVYGLIKPPETEATQPLIPPKKIRDTFPILQGATNETTTQVAVVVPKDQTFRYQLRIGTGTDVIMPKYQERFERSASKFGSDQVMFEGLALGVEYTFEVIDASGAALDSRCLRTLNLKDKTTSFLVISCMRDNKPAAEIDAIWDSVINNKPNCMFWTGDNCYASFAGPVDADWHWDRFIESRQKFKIFHDERLIPTFASWDDHDYGMNDGDHTYEHKDGALENMRALFAQREMEGSYVLGPGYSSHLTAFGQEFIFMDGRYYKGLPGCDGLSSSFGKDGEEWLDSRLAVAAGPIWLSNGIMYFKTLPICESYEKQHPKNFKNFLARLKTITQPIIFVSGDIHLSMITRVPKEYLGYNTYELSSSGLISFRAPIFFCPPAKRKICGVYKNNYVQVKPIAVQPTKIAAEITAYGVKNKIYFREYLAVVAG